MAMRTKREADASTLCCHPKPADARGSWNSETVQPWECSAVLMPNPLILFTQVLHHFGEVLQLPH